MSNQIKFEVETQRVLEILSKEIYDSPLALLRENVQNAYDAILMRCARDNSHLSTGKIEITLSGLSLQIQDNGIGMTEEVLRENFWKAGSSGKRTELASKAGVIGTFGIGAMANFGIATKLELITRSRESQDTLKSAALRDTLSIAEECISLEHIRDNHEEGTTVTVTLEERSSLTEQQAKQYLRGYVTYVPVQIFFNGELLSTQTLDTSVPFSSEQLTDCGVHSVQAREFVFSAHIGLNKQGLVRTEITNIKLSGRETDGSMLLSQGSGSIMGYRNFFGLSNAPITTAFQLGGIANLSFLTPTAGREALARESILQIQTIVIATEKIIAEEISKTEFANGSIYFQSYIVSKRRYDLAGNIEVEIRPDHKPIRLNSIKSEIASRHPRYYAGRDSGLIQQFSNPGSALLLISQSNPKRQIQDYYIRNILRIPSIPDKATITRRYSPRELTLAEAALSIRTSTTLADEYFLTNYEIQFADITHAVQFFIEGNQQSGVIYIARNCFSIRALLECYDTTPEIFSALITDFVRNHIYPRVKQFVPSSTQGGADALRAIIEKNRELYRYADSDLGEIESILSDYLTGETSFGEVIRKAARATNRPQRQSVGVEQVGNVENVIQDVIESPTTIEEEEKFPETEPRPAIIRDDIECEFKILTTAKKYQSLNQFTLFLGLSERLFRRESIFFKSPHTTRVLWGGHRIIYIFGHPSGSITLYYNIELQTPLSQDKTSGLMIPTTTLILKNRLFIPIPHELESEFRISEGKKQFHVNFDTIP